MPSRLRIIGQQPCFHHPQYIQFSGAPCARRSLFVHMKLRIFRPLFLLLFAGVLCTALAVAQSSTQTPSDNSVNAAAGQSAKGSADASTQGQTGAQQVDPLKRPLTEKQKKANSKALKQELSSTDR